MSAKKEQQPSQRDSSKEPQKNSLQSFVTKVNKGEAFGGMKKYAEKRDSSARRTQKPQLNLDERANKPIRAVDLDLKAPKTTPNVESKVFTISLGKGSVSPTAASSQSLVAKKGTKEIQKAVQEGVVRAKAQGKEPFIYYMTHLEKAHKWGGEPDYFVQIYQEHFLQSFQALGFCKAMKQPDPVVLAQKRVNFPKRDTHKDKRTLVFDMDETLIHCNESLDMPADVILPIIFPNGEVVEAGINIRPYAIEILRELSQYFEIMVFTASHSCYANVVLDYLDPHEEFIHHRLFRESCVVSEEGLHVKDLRVIGNRNLQDLILVDNAAYSFGMQLENGIPIIPFYDNKADQELRNLIPYLKFLSSVKDLREVNKQTFKLHHYLNYDEPEELLEKVIFQN
jgi:CTD small phosphatase-like protein 2